MMKNELSFMDEYKVTPNEIALIRAFLVYQDTGEKNELLTILRVLKESHMKTSSRDVLQMLMDKGIVLKSSKIPKEGKPFDPNDIHFSKQITKAIYTCDGKLGTELRSVYPAIIDVNGKQYDGHSIGKNFDSLETFDLFYQKCIKFDLDKHQEIIELVKWEQDNNIGFLSMNIGNFVRDRVWERLALIKTGEMGGIMYDTMNLL